MEIRAEAAFFEAGPSGHDVEGDSSGVWLTTAEPAFLPPRTPDSQIDAVVDAVDWYTDYGPEYVAPSPETVDRATRLAKRIVAAGALLGEAVPVPDFSPTANGSVDLHWGDGTERELLLGVRPSGEVASYFGSASDGTTIKGSINITHANTFLAAWILDC